MYCGILVTAVELPVTVIALLPMTPRNIVGTLAENVTVEVMSMPALVTTGVTLLSVYPVGPRHVAVEDIPRVGHASRDRRRPRSSVPAAIKAGDFLATEPTLAASIADCSLLRSWVALL